MQSTDTEINTASLTIRRLDAATKERLRQQAARHGHSMEEEARRILSRAVTPAPPRSAFEALRRPLASTGGIELEPPARHAPRDVPGSAV